MFSFEHGGFEKMFCVRAKSRKYTRIEGLCQGDSARNKPHSVANDLIADANFAKFLFNPGTSLLDSSSYAVEWKVTLRLASPVRSIGVESLVVCD